jgi:hypothetical protein
MSEKIDIIHHWNEVGALHNPNDIRLAMIIEVDRNMMIPQTQIKKIEERVLRQLLLHFINERQ